ncbi:MAG: ribosome biogenesis GTPase YlqF [Clostridiales bacterium]|nr:ribosome biogenesis GTPase YlqF [Candidatus Equinaster intestinalis]
MENGGQYIQWFPGHMAKTKRKIAEVLPLIDAVAEITDARIPLSSRNPDILDIVGNKPRVILLNKCDMADEKVTAQWIDYYKKNGITALPVDCKSGKGLSLFKSTLKENLKDKLEQYRAKGLVGKPLRIMVVGIPNVGKSSFINKIAGNTKAKVENRPGVTRGNQWFTIDKELELLDTPGVLWPKFDDITVGEHLAFTGAVKDRVVDIELLAVRLLEILSADYRELLISRYGSLDFECEAYELLEQIGKRRGMVIRGGETDTERASNMLLEEFRNCKIGKISLERVENA